jgi:hypothetical protein
MKSGTESAIKIHPACHRMEIALKLPTVALSSTNRQPNVSIIAVYVLASIFADAFTNMLYALFLLYRANVEHTIPLCL